MKSVNNKKYTLILTKNFQPVSIRGVVKTMKYLVTGQGKALDPISYQLYDFDEWVTVNQNKAPVTTIRTEKLWILIPEIIVLNRSGITKKSPSTKISKKKVFERDSYICGYCGKKLNGSDKTIDHIIPKSRGGSKHDYKNVISCCSKCNSKKDNHLLEEIGWTLKFPATNPNQNILYNIPQNKWLDSWETFLPNQMSVK